MTYDGEDKRANPPTAADLIARLTGSKKAGLIVAVMALSGLTVNGVYQFLKDAPAIVSANTRVSNANAREIARHHDSIAQNSEFSVAAAQHLAADDSANSSRDRKLDYLVCLRTERARDLRGDPALRDCDAELLR